MFGVDLQGILDFPIKHTSAFRRLRGVYTGAVYRIKDTQKFVDILIEIGFGRSLRYFDIEGLRVSYLEDGAGHWIGFCEGYILLQHTMSYNVMESVCQSKHIFTIAEMPECLFKENKYWGISSLVMDIKGRVRIC